VLNERTRHIRKVANKIQAASEIYAPHRERAVFQRIKRNQATVTEERMRSITARSCRAPCRWKQSMAIAYSGRKKLSPSSRHPEICFVEPSVCRAQKNHCRRFNEVSKNRATTELSRYEIQLKGSLTHTLYVVISRLKNCRQILLPNRYCLAGMRIKGNPAPLRPPPALASVAVDP